MVDFDKYFKALQVNKIEDITEHSYRGALKELLESLASKGTNILHEPKREGKFGAPDFKITIQDSIIGYVENKKVEENLDKTLKSEQILKYQTLSDNILITNYIEWVWVKEGTVQKRATLCYLSDIENKRAKLNKANIQDVELLIKSFLSQPPKYIGDAKKLAVALASRARLLKDFLQENLTIQASNNTDGRVYQLYQTFKEYVFNELSIEAFADAFAQNLVYGLFLARLNADANTISLYNAKKYIPTSFELIRELVNFLDELDNEEYRETKWIVEEVLAILNNIDLTAIQNTLSFTTKRLDENNTPIKDPYIYFYEDFLAAYDSKLRKAKGVYYTPPSVVNFIVRAIDDILIDTFGITSGLADHNKVTVLDFATGTGTFLLEVLQQIFTKLPADSGKKELLIKDHILKNIYGFEYLIAPYTIAHLKLSQFLKDNGYTLKDKERIQVYLTNTLEPIANQIKIPFLPALTEETRQAQNVKNKPILVITGNPPYSGHSKNNGEWISNKMQNYYFADGKPLGEKNPKWLQDDYVKFIRFAQDKMDTVEEGIVGIITNHSFLDNPTFRGMRQSLMKTFDQIYFIDLHGNAKKKEKTPQGEKDVNVFDIEQGVAISIFIKKKGLEKKIYHTDFWGTRVEKYNRSEQENLKSILWNTLLPTSPFYLFIKQDTTNRNHYNSFYTITSIFAIYKLGVFTHRDKFLIDVDKSVLEKRIASFKGVANNTIAEEKFGLSNTRDWKIDEALKEIRKNKIIIKQYAFRPFDTRYICYNQELYDRGCSRFEFMKPIIEKEVLTLNTSRNLQIQGEFKDVLVSNLLTDAHYCTGGNYVFPLYVYATNSNLNFNIQEKNDSLELVENFTSQFRSHIKALYQQHFSPQDILGYIYAILHSPTYRSKYTEFLKTDFPRIPFTTDEDLFLQLAKMGNELISYHLFTADFIPKNNFFIGTGNHIIETINYIADKNNENMGRLYINKTQYFSAIPLSVYQFQIGGYQVLDKYLKDRKGTKIESLNVLEKIEKIIASISFTLYQMKLIDKITASWV